jgi:prepilin-type N-terminal cleavage/methylation domain-containing protein
MARADRRGFTLIEVLVALTIGSAVVLLVHQAFGSVTDMSARLNGERVRHARRMAGLERLVQVFGSLDVTTVRSRGFEGSPNRAAFATATDGPSRLVTLTARNGWLLLSAADGPADTLLAADAVMFDYLLSYGSQSSWVQAWHSPVSAPLAVRVRLHHGDQADTLFFLVGPRG